MDVEGVWTAHREEHLQQEGMARAVPHRFLHPHCCPVHVLVIPAPAGDGGGSPFSESLATMTAVFLCQLLSVTKEGPTILSPLPRGSRVEEGLRSQGSWKVKSQQALRILSALRVRDAESQAA